MGNLIIWPNICTHNKNDLAIKTLLRRTQINKTDYCEAVFGVELSCGGTTLFLTNNEFELPFIQQKARLEELLPRRRGNWCGFMGNMSERRTLRIACYEDFIINFGLILFVIVPTIIETGIDVQNRYTIDNESAE